MFSNNPQSVYNGMMSGHRNMFLLSTVAVAMIGFLKGRNYVLQLAASFLFIIAAMIGIQSSLDFDYYLKNNNVPENTYRYTTFNVWKQIGFVYAGFLLILGLYTLFGKIGLIE